MTIECIVLDFDGTFTRVDEEAKPFLASFREGFETRMGSELAGRWDEVTQRVQADPDRYGWEFEERIVAPSHADPYVLANTVGQILLADAGISSAGARSEILDALFKQSYPKAGIAFRDDARVVVEALALSGIPLFVVTNSRTDHVKAKLDALAPEGRERLDVRGEARKFVIGAPDKQSELFDRVPETMHVPGLERPLYLHRGPYFEVLQRIWDETGTEPRRTLVCGDIFELDLAMRAHLGTRVHLVTRPSTPDWERRAVRSMPGGTASAELRGLLDQLELPG